MSLTRSVNVVVRDSADLGDVFVSNDGRPNASTVTGLINADHPDIDFVVSVVPSTGVAGLRDELESGESSLIGSGADLVVFSIADEVDRLSAPSSGVEEILRAIDADLVAVIELIKEKVGAHVFIANMSTIEPDSAVFNYHGLDEEPYTLRAHRLNLLLVGVSHNEGISIIDVDRKIAEVGGGTSVLGPSRYTENGCAAIAHEVVRIVEEYGFLDDRPLLEQVGARSAGERS